jgi:hypothetical protein
VRREPAWPATIRDISVNGIGLVLRRRFECGVLLAIEVPGGDEGPFRLLARVVRITAQAGDSWLLGCALLHPLTDEELAGLVRQVAARNEHG